jgi:hypothetical protein
MAESALKLCQNESIISTEKEKKNIGQFVSFGLNSHWESEKESTKNYGPPFSLLGKSVKYNPEQFSICPTYLVICKELFPSFSSSFYGRRVFLF